MIRPALLSDLDDLMRLETTFGEDGFSRDQMLASLNDAKGSFFLVHQSVSDAPIDGYILVEHYRLDCYLAGIAVDAASRRRGVGRRMLLSAIDMLRRSGFRKMKLDVRPDNFSAQRLYESCGFFAIVPSGNAYSDGMPAITMLLKLRR